jgi:hypothetical protein
MKTSTFSWFVIIVFFLVVCGEDGSEGPAGQDGQDGNANVYYSPWYSPPAWAGQTGDWYYNVNDNAITEDIVERGAILAYMSLPVDIYATAVRPMPAYVDNANWDFLIPDYGMIEFTSDALDVPGTTDYYFRFILIPSNIQLKSKNVEGSGIVGLKELQKMSYKDVCKELGIPE